MGNRMNVGIKQGDNTLYVYAHWGWSKMFNELAIALQKVKAYGRLDDPSYGTRIIVQSLIPDVDGLGYGLSINALDDNEHKVPVFDFDSQTVSLYDDDRKLFTMPVERFIEKYV